MFLKNLTNKWEERYGVKGLYSLCPSGVLRNWHNIGRLESLDLTHQEVQNLLLRTKQHSATGPDGISAWMLKTFAVEITPSLASLFNLSIRTGQLPAEWNRRVVLGR